MVNLNLNVSAPSARTTADEPLPMACGICVICEVLLVCGPLLLFFFGLAKFAIDVEKDPLPMVYACLLLIAAAPLLAILESLRWLVAYFARHE